MGPITHEVVMQRHRLVIEHLREKGRQAVIYDLRQATYVSEDAEPTQRRMNEELIPLIPRLAIVVSETKLAYRARLAFHSFHSQIFYDDFDMAMKWVAWTD